MKSVLFVCLSVSQQDYCKRNQQILLKRGVVIEPTSRRNWSTFAGDSVRYTDSGLRLLFPYRIAE